MAVVVPLFREEQSGEITRPPREERRSLGRYRLRFELAQGGMATVYLAHTRGPMGVGKVVAIKVIHPHLAREQEFVEMFLDEARLAATINHPNVCGVIDFGEADGTYYMAMEYLQGEPLARIHRALKRDEQAPLEALPLFAARLVADAAEGLHAAHELVDVTGRPLGVIHRDVSPSNVFVTYDGAVRVVDFGIARAENRIHHTATGTVKGKFAYMAPEQMRGQSVDRRADVWALGVLLWETIALRRLFRRGSDPETVFAVAQDPVPRLTDVRPGTPAMLDRIVQRALSREVDERYPTARAMAQELEQFIAKHGGPFGIADASSWMHALFAKAMTRKTQLVQLTAQTDAPVPAAPLHDELDQESASLRVLSVPEMTAVDLTPRGAQSRARPIAAGAIAALALGLALIAFTTLGEERASPESGLAPSAPAEPPRIEAPAPEIVVAPPAPTPTVPPETPAAPEPPAPRASHARLARIATSVSAPAGPPGRVAVVTIGAWADVYFRGARLGQTPGTFSLPPGRHTLELRPLGSGSRRVPVVVRSGETARIRVELSGD
ncbi:serine/threonine-protein kinase [Sandaracinus amylolyticus]|uniref:serine/threonine-protein kinase n=1 Tax=Sandaracinus amylolyticus TaxID=927083 RepID=UPI001EFFEB50|nr:serine/threonine-protein kinase [Sandaracinus amylolyticus]UJR78729.1 Serine/threonine protein kinase PrkC, regulator of stationary phase [Sandaracinus amylolyticus]